MIGYRNLLVGRLKMTSDNPNRSAPFSEASSSNSAEFARHKESAS